MCKLLIIRLFLLVALVTPFILGGCATYKPLQKAEVIHQGVLHKEKRIVTTAFSKPFAPKKKQLAKSNAKQNGKWLLVYYLESRLLSHMLLCSRERPNMRYVTSKSEEIYGEIQQKYNQLAIKRLKNRIYEKDRFSFSSPSDFEIEKRYIITQINVSLEKAYVNETIQDLLFDIKKEGLKAYEKKENQARFSAYIKRLRRKARF